MFYNIFLTVIYQWVSYKESHLCQTNYCYILRVLFGLGLTAIFVVGGLGTENQYNYLIRALILPHVIYFVILG
jgi:hypothetical protein